MGRYISRNNPISVRALKRRENGTVIRHHNGRWEDARFTRCAGGWLRERLDFTGLSPEVVSSVAVATECNKALGCKESWAEVY